MPFEPEDISPTVPIPFVILSGTYCHAEIASEYGKLPPSFLPVANRRLYEMQIDMARKYGARPILTLPADYVVPATDLAALHAQSVRIVRSPISLSLTEAIQFVLEVIDTQGPIYLLFGDTLVEGEGLTELDRIAVHQTQGYYNWSYIVGQPDGSIRVESGYGDGEESRAIVCGFFAFSDVDTLRQAFVTGNDFAAGLNAYMAARPTGTIDVTAWYDFGHLALIYQSKCNMLVSRSFNSTTSDGVVVTKTSHLIQKMAAEASWYEDIPDDLKVFTPQYLGRLDEDTGYKIEYLYLPTLAEIFTFGNLSGNVWKMILNSCLQFLQRCRQVKPPAGSYFATDAFAHRFHENIHVAKTHERMDAFLRSRNCGDDVRIELNGERFPPLRSVIDRLIDCVRPTVPQDISLWHGDLFFGNMFYDFRANRIRVIDPRGGDSTEKNSIFGDFRYDIAKLAHSIIGGYDVILANRCQFAEHGEWRFGFEREQSKSREVAEHYFRAAKIGNLPIFDREIQAMTSLLFLTMLPLHAESPRRQAMMLCNGLLIARELL